MITTLPAEEGWTERGKTEATAMVGVEWDADNDVSANRGEAVPAAVRKESVAAVRPAERITLELTMLKAKNTAIAPANE
jgi:hypothetical protein